MGVVYDNCKYHAGLHGITVCLPCWCARTCEASGAAQREGGVRAREDLRDGVVIHDAQGAFALDAEGMAEREAQAGHLGHEGQLREHELHDIVEVPRPRVDSLVDRPLHGASRESRESLLHWGLRESIQSAWELPASSWLASD